jgi:hypothetical protein
MPWSGKATYDSFSIIGEDVSRTCLLLSAQETPFLDAIGDAEQPATNVAHQWREQALGPDRIVNSSAINSATAATGILVNGFGNQLQVGMLLEVEANVAGVANEIVQISSIPAGSDGNSILVTRAFGGSANGSLAAGGNLFVISTAELEGSETTGDVNRPRTSRTNWTQIFKKPILLTGSDRAVRYAPDLGDEFDHQATLRTIELMRDLEKAVFRSRASGNSIGSASAYRTMDGLRSWLTGINSVIVASSFAADPLLYVNDVQQRCWSAGARDLDIIVAGAQWKRELSATNAARLYVEQADQSIQRKVEFLTTDFGDCRLILSPWLADRHFMVLSSRRVKVVPLQGRSFQRELLAKTGDADKGHVIGEYTLEVHHPDKMGQAHI